MSVLKLGQTIFVIEIDPTASVICPRTNGASFQLSTNFFSRQERRNLSFNIGEKKMSKIAKFGCEMLQNTKNIDL